jgi:hypothetical protein
MINKKARQVKQSRKPSNHTNNMKGFYPQHQTTPNK